MTIVLGPQQWQDDDTVPRVPVRAHDNGQLPCAWCGRPTPALVNGRPTCSAHLRQARETKR